MANDDFEADWRASVTRQLEQTAKVQNDTAVVLERLDSRITAAENTLRTHDTAVTRVERLDGRVTAVENAIKDIKESPNAIRGNVGVIMQAGGCLGTIIFAGLSIIGTSLSIVVFILHH